MSAGRGRLLPLDRGHDRADRLRRARAAPDVSPQRSRRPLLRQRDYTLSTHAKKILAELPRDVRLTVFVRSEDPAHPATEGSAVAHRSGDPPRHLRLRRLERSPALARQLRRRPLRGDRRRERVPAARHLESHRDAVDGRPTSRHPRSRAHGLFRHRTRRAIPGRRRSQDRPVGRKTHARGRPIRRARRCRSCAPNRCRSMPPSS